ncbi:MAG TPA: cellulase family glycosylhydrolase [Polyangia bacterium]
MTTMPYRILPIGLVFLSCAQSATPPSTHGSGGASGGSGGMTATGGTTASGGSSARGGTSGSGGATGVGGISAAGGSSGTGGGSARGGSSATGGGLSTGGSAGSGGSSATGGDSGFADAGDVRGPGEVGDVGGSDVLIPDASPSSDAGSCKGATAAQAPSGVTPLRAIDGFVTRNGSDLSLCGQPFQIFGTNTYYVQSYAVYESGSLGVVGSTFDDMVRMSLPVARMWAFNAVSGDGAIIESAAGTYSETGLVGLDTAIAEAKKRGIRVILTLSNYWSDYGGLPLYAKWAGASGADAFYTNTTMQGYFKAYATMLSRRTNTVTKVAYKDEPAILAWEIANEMRCPSCTDSSPVTAAIDSLSKFLKSLFPNHLIADGGEGLDDTPSNWGTLSNTYPVSGGNPGGGERTSYTNMVKLSALDLASYHYYPVGWGMAATPLATVASDAKTWIDGHTALAKAAGKVPYWGEFGFKPNSGITDAERAPVYDNWLTTFFGADNGGLALFWQLMPQNHAADDGYACILGRDTNTVTVFEKYSQPRAPRGN